MKNTISKWGLKKSQLIRSFFMSFFMIYSYSNNDIYTPSSQGKVWGDYSRDDPKEKGTVLKGAEGEI